MRCVGREDCSPAGRLNPRGGKRSASVRRAGRRGVPGSPPAASSLTPSDSRCGVCHCTSTSRSPACSSRSASTSPTRATLEASRARWNIDSPANSPPDRETVEPALEPVVAPRLDRVRPTECVQAHVGLAHPPVDPPVRAPRVGAGVDDLGEGGVDADLELPHRAAQRARDHQVVELEHPAVAPATTTPSAPWRCAPSRTASGTAHVGSRPGSCPARGRRRSRRGPPPRRPRRCRRRPTALRAARPATVPWGWSRQPAGPCG